MVFPKVFLSLNPIYTMQVAFLRTKTWPLCRLQLKTMKTPYHRILCRLSEYGESLRLKYKLALCFPFNSHVCCFHFGLKNALPLTDAIIDLTMRQKLGKMLGQLKSQEINSSYLVFNKQISKINDKLYYFIQVYILNQSSKRAYFCQKRLYENFVCESKFIC